MSNVNMDLSICIVAYKNNEDILMSAVNSVLNSEGLNLKLYIVDNSPTDELRSLFKNDDRIEYIFNDANNGFGAGHNVIMKQPLKMGKYHLVLNPDISFQPNVLKELYNYMEENCDVGNVIPKIVFPNGTFQYVCKLLPRPIDWFVRMFVPFKSVKDKINYRFEMKFADFSKPMNVPYLSGCFMFFRTAVIHEIGLFDEHIFMYGEDTDINRRIHQKYRTMYYPYVTATHAYEGGTHKNLRLFWITVKALTYYLTKWGWFFDSERQKINKETIERYSIK